MLTLGGCIKGKRCSSKIHNLLLFRTLMKDIYTAEESKRKLSSPHTGQLNLTISFSLKSLLNAVGYTFSCLLVYLFRCFISSIKLGQPCNAMHAKSLQLCLFATLSTVAYQAPLSMEFPRQEYWSRLPFPSSGDLLHSGIEPVSLASCIGRQVLYPNAPGYTLISLFIFSGLFYFLNQIGSTCSNSHAPCTFPSQHFSQL